MVATALPCLPSPILLAIKPPTAAPIAAPTPLLALIAGTSEPDSTIPQFATDCAPLDSRQGLRSY